MTERHNRPDYIIFAALAAFALILPMTKVADFDIFFHLRMGELTYETASIPKADTLSYTAPGQALYRGDWLSNLILHLFYRGAGWGGLSAFKVFMFALTMFFVWKSCRLMEGNKGVLIAASAVVLAGLAMRFRLNLRPYYFSFLFFSIYIYSFLKYDLQYNKNGNLKALYPLPIIQILWANTHGSAIVGPAVTAVFAITQSLREKRLIPGLWAILLLVFIAEGLSPEGFKAYGLFIPFIPSPGAEEGSGFSIAQVDEWMPLNAQMLWGYGMRYTLAFQALALGSVAFLAVEAFKRRLRLFHLLFVAGCIFYSIRHARLIDLSSIALAPFFAGFLLTVAENIEKRFALIKSVPRVFMSFAGAAAILLIAYVSVFRSPIYTFGIGPKERVYPQRQIEFLKTNNIEGRGFNTIPAGSYVLFADKERPVFIDGRLSYPGNFITTYYHALRSAGTFAELDHSYGFSYALAEYGSRPTWKFPSHLGKNPEWALVSWDDAGALWIKRTPQNEGLINKSGYSVLRPSFMNFGYLDAHLKEGEAALAAIDRDISLNPGFQEPHLAKAYAAYWMGLKDVARKELDIAFRMKPDTSLEHLSMAVLLAEGGKRREAMKEAREALRIDPFNSQAKDLIKQLEGQR